MRVARYVRRNAILMISHVPLNPLLLILHYINFTVYLLAATDRSTRYYLRVNTEEVVSFFGPCAHVCIARDALALAFPSVCNVTIHP